MLKIFKEHKKIWLIAILIIVVPVVLVFMEDYLYLRKAISRLGLQKAEEEVQKDGVEDWSGVTETRIRIEKEECQTNFDFNKLDFNIKIWDSELSTMLKGLLVLRAIDQNNRDLCNYEKKEIDPSIKKERCERDYDFYFMLTEKLEKDMDSQQYVKECQEALLPSASIEGVNGEDIDILKERVRTMCESYYQSFQNKTAVILDPTFMCDGDPARHDTVEYLDPQTNQTKSCVDEDSDEIKFLIAVAKNDPTDCLVINNFRTSQYCQFYFGRDLMPFQNKFKEAYCHNLVNKRSLLFQ